MDIQAKRDRRTRIAFVIQQSFEYFISMFVSGNFLGYILESLGFNDAQQGIILTVATFTCGAQLFALVTTGHRAKRIATEGHLLNQLCFVALYLLPIGQSISAEIKAVIFVIFACRYRVSRKCFRNPRSYALALPCLCLQTVPPRWE